MNTKLLVDRLRAAEFQRNAALDELSAAKTALRDTIDDIIAPYANSLEPLNSDTDRPALIDFFESETGMRILHALELARRCAMVDVHTGLPVEGTDELRATLDAIFGEEEESSELRQ